MVTIINYGLGNLRSVQKAFERLGYEAKISNKLDDILSSSKLVLPGVGYFQKGMENLQSLGLIDILNLAVVEHKIPILGICLGMQLMTTYSEEGNCEGLNWISAETKKFNFNTEQNNLKIPHMGWNEIKINLESSEFNEQNNSLYYFVHSYYVTCKSQEDILFRTKYGIEFVSGFKKKNIWGLQFHPEKSHKAGLFLIKKFINLS